jgi:hypothetical protein
MRLPGRGVAGRQDRDLHLWRMRAEPASVVAMSEVLISFQRPASLSDSELRAWISERSRRHNPALALGEPGGSGNPSLVRVDLRPDSDLPIDEQLTDLMMDMRLLGLRPAIVSADGDGSARSRPFGSG